MSSYVFDNAAAPTGQRFAGLQACYDQVTIRQLEQHLAAARPLWRAGASRSIHQSRRLPQPRP